MSKKSIVLLSCCWVLSLIVCGWVNFTYFPPSPVFPDENRYLASASDWLRNGEFISNHGRAWEMPLTSLFFAALQLLKGDGHMRSIHIIREAQSVLLLIQSWLVWRITRQIFGSEKTCLAAASITALYPFFIFYQGLALSETLFNTMLLSSFAALYDWRANGCKIGGGLVAVIVWAGLATYAKASLTLLPPLLLAVTSWSKGEGKRNMLSVLVVGLLVYVVVMSPWWVRNYLLFKDFVPFTTSSASNLYLGNNAANNSGGNDWGKDVERDVVARINALPGELEQQAAYSEAAKHFMQQHPIKCVKLFIIKFKRYWNVIPNAEGYNSGWKALLAALSFGPILLLSLLGMWVNRGRWRCLLPIYLLIVYFTMLHTLTIASLRYRLPLEPFLIILAAGAVSAFQLNKPQKIA